MYGMVEIKVDELDGIANDVEFANKLLNEQMVFVLPGKCFGIENFIRIVFAAPKSKLRVAYERIKAFCMDHIKPEALERFQAERAF